MKCYEVDDYIPVNQNELNITIAFGKTVGIISAISTLSVIFILCYNWNKLVKEYDAKNMNEALLGGQL